MTFDMEAHDRYFYGMAADDTKKPGGSNAGKYKKGPFCGPSGGAPKGTYPVDTKKRAIAAIAYARNAPNPQGIKDCVHKHWPELKKTAQKQEAVREDALCFEEATPVELVFKENPDTKEATFEMVAHSGKPILGHWYWGNLGIDFDGMKMPSGRLPILKDHMTDQIIGHAAKPSIEDGKLVVRDMVLMDNGHANEFKANAEKKFPYQASIYAKPTKIERLGEGESAMVNGHEVKGPGSIWRKSTLKEASVCVFGADPNTSTRAFADRGPVELSFEEVPVDENYDAFMEGENMPTIEQFKESDPQGYADLEAKLTEKITADVSAKFAADGKAKDDALAASTAQVSALSDAVKDMQFQFAVIAEKEMAAQAKGIVAVKLSASKIPARLHDFVQVGYDKFVEDKKFNAEKFAEAVDAAIKDVETRLSEAGMGSTAPAIIGGGMPPAAPDSTEKFSDEDGQKAAADLLKGFGIVIPA